MNLFKALFDRAARALGWSMADKQVEKLAAEEGVELPAQPKVPGLLAKWWHGRSTPYVSANKPRRHKSKNYVRMQKVSRMRNLLTGKNGGH